MGEETGMGVRERDEEEERVVLVVAYELDGVVDEELRQATMLERLSHDGGVVVEEA